MTEIVYPVPAHFKAQIGADELEALYAAAEADPQRHWLDQARRLDWYREPDGSR